MGKLKNTHVPAQIDVVGFHLCIFTLFLHNKFSIFKSVW